MQPIIQVSHLHYKVEAEIILKDLNFIINQGELVLITGENGSGKTTLVKLLLNIQKATSGNISLFDTNIQNFSEWSKIGYLPQNLYQVLEDLPLTVEEFIHSGAIKNAGYYSKRRQELNDIFKFDSYSNKLLNSLSGGQAQRVFLARSLINNPKVLILDEPTSGIDKQSKLNLIRLIKELHKSDICIIIITHEIDIFQEISDRILCISQNSIQKNPDLEHVHT